MKRTVHLLAGILLMIAFSISAYAQKIREVQLVEPDRFQTAGGLIGGAGDVGAIYYGAVPPNSSSKPVLVFIHGYTSNARVWWEDNDMYSKAYNDGYRTAFVSVHPDKSMWANGQMFAGMLNTIANHYGVNRVVVIAHSKGGVDSDAALVHYGAYNRVERVITLGTPHFGTPLANLAQSGWVSWLSYVFGQKNEATYVLQTGYMDYFRSVTDPHVNRPKTNFRTFGAWGYSGILTVSGWYLNLNGGSKSNGGNDGVVNYNSTKRPNSAVIFGKLDSRGDVNHFEIAEGSKMWNHIKGQLPGTLSREQAAEMIAGAYNPNAVVESQAQIIASENGQATVLVEPGARALKIEVFTESPDEVWLLNPQTQERILLQTEANLRNDFLGDFVHTAEVERVGATEYIILNASKSRMVVIAATEGGSILRFSSDLNAQKLTYERGEPMHLQVQVNGYLPSNAEVSGTLLYVGDLEGKPAEGGAAYRLSFKHAGNGQFNTTFTEDLKPGIYAINLEARGNQMQKNIVHTIAVVERQANGYNQDTQDEQTGFAVYPNPSTTGYFSIVLDKAEAPANIRVYDIAGRRIAAWSTTTLQTQWQAPAHLQNGIYLIEVEQDGQSRTQRLVLNR
ncbi:T9SS type A sorting domain-containing protein [Thermonema rossianum]|uniref:T9SS type A sorting domain-containing protein n=1 Tax=Thermonema rossianum TaxID=55505 RepID=UPI00068B882B|nr:T9SS type A sorting domain-containing protein [Thermonema rossianum]